MDGVQPQGVDVKVLNPVERVLDKEVPHFITIWPVKIQGRSPRCVIAVREVRSILRKIIAFWSQVVVDDIQRHGQALTVRGVHEGLQLARRTITIVNGARINAVVSPVSLSGKLRNRHQFNGVNPQISKLVEAANCSRQRALRSKGPDMKLIKNQFLERQALPQSIGPFR